MFFNFTYNVNNLIAGNTAYNSQADTNEESGINVQALHQQFNNIFITLTKATEAIINVSESETHLYLIIKDNGRGFDPATLTQKRMGLSIMKERAESILAECKIESQVGSGTAVTVQWPLPIIKEAE